MATRLRRRRRLVGARRDGALADASARPIDRAVGAPRPGASADKAT